MLYNINLTAENERYWGQSQDYEIGYLKLCNHQVSDSFSKLGNVVICAWPWNFSFSGNSFCWLAKCPATTVFMLGYWVSSCWIQIFLLSPVLARPWVCIQVKKLFHRFDFVSWTIWQVWEHIFSRGVKRCYWLILARPWIFVVGKTR